MKIRPLHGFLHVHDLPVATENKTASGIILQQNREPRIRYGRVLAVGHGVDKKGRKVHHEVGEGDIVLYDCYMGNQYDDASYHEGKSWRILSEDQLLAVVPDADENDLPKVEAVGRAHR